MQIRLGEDSFDIKAHNSKSEYSSEYNVLCCYLEIMVITTWTWLDHNARGHECPLWYHFLFWFFYTWLLVAPHDRQKFKIKFSKLFSKKNNKKNVFFCHNLLIKSRISFFSSIFFFIIIFILCPRQNELYFRNENMLSTEPFPFVFHTRKSCGCSRDDIVKQN